MAIVESDDMGIFTTPDPRTERYEKLRKLVELGIAQFRKVGAALREIRDQELYKLDCRSFEECCKRHWGITPQHANRLIDAATFADEVEPTGSVPTSEHQVRQLRELPRELRVEAWTEAAEAGATPEAIATAVAKRRRKNSKKPKLARPIKLRVPGGWVQITPNAKFTTAEVALEHALTMLRTKNAAA